MREQCFSSTGLMVREWAVDVVDLSGYSSVAASMAMLRVGNVVSVLCF